mgnify:CR=1 FL=1
MSNYILVEIGKERFTKSERESIKFTNIEHADELLNDIEQYPHAYVLACLMDRQIKAEKAWLIPYKISKIVGSFKIDDLLEISLDEYKDIFRNNSLHRFNDIMADVFFNGIYDIKNKYDGDASNIWRNNPSSAKVVYEFLQFKGSGIKISTMAANILARQFKIPFSDYYSIDISPDVHILRVLRRTGLVSKTSDANSIIYKARELNPEFPGIIDFSCWEIGRTWCKPKNPDCEKCVIRSECTKIIKT